MYVPYEDKIYDDKLNPCRCGGTVTLSIKDSSYESSEGRKFLENWEIHCLKCGGFWYFPADDLCGRKHWTKEEVVKKWNDEVGDKND